jgi:hypothetical protein
VIGPVPARRRALAFAEALDERDRELGDDPADGDGGHDGEHAPLFTLADGLGSLPRPALDPEVKTVQRAQLIAAMESAFAQGAAGAGDGLLPGQRSADRTGRHADGAPRASGLGRLRPRSRLGKGIAAGGLSVGVAATAFGGVAAASSDALPGDTLYGLKRGMEDLRLDWAGGDGDRGRIHLDHASTRLREARRLLERDRAGVLDHESLGEIRRVLSGMQHDASEGHRLLSAVYARNGEIAPMQSLSSFSRDHRSRWAEIRGRLPVQLHDVGAEVSSVFDAMEEEVRPLRSLFPPTEEESGRDAGRTTAPSGSGAGREAPADPSPSRSAPERGEKDGGRPQPSGSGSGDGGLFDDGLLDPPGDPRDDRPEESGPGRPDLPGTDPDFTLPPLLPDVLPGLGVESGDG